MENVQKRLLRNVYEDYESSYHELLLKSKVATLEDLVYKLRHPIRTTVPKYSSVTYGLKSLRCLGNKIWNSLPINIKMSESLCSFKNKKKSKSLLELLV